MSDQSGLFSSSSHFVLRLYARPYTKIFMKRHLRCLSRSAVFCHWTTIINGSSILTSLLMCLETTDTSRLCYSLWNQCFLQGHILYYICTRGHTQIKYSLAAFFDQLSRNTRVLWVMKRTTDETSGAKWKNAQDTIVEFIAIINLLVLDNIISYFKKYKILL